MTGTQDRRSRRRDDTHRRIYAVAMRLFEEHGYERVSVGQIAAAASVSVPTFYDHFAGKEQIVLQVPTGEELARVLEEQPLEQPLGERIRGATRRWFAMLDAGGRAEALARWRIIAATPSLRLRAAEYERITAGLLVDRLAPAADGTAVPGASVVVGAYLSAVTAALLAWADSDGELDLEKLVDEAFRALQDT